MRKATIVVGVIGLLIGMVFFIPNGTIATERAPVESGRPYTLDGYGTTATGWISVSPGDLITFNWRTGSITSGEFLTVTLNPSTAAMNWSGCNENIVYESNPPYNPKSYSYAQGYSYGTISPQSFWVRVSSADMIYFRLISTPNLPIQTYNFTIISNPDTSNQKIKDLQDKYNSLNNTLNNLGHTINDFDNITDNISYNLSIIKGEISTLGNDINDIRYSLNENDTNLLGQLNDLLMLINLINDSLSTQITSIPTYNDTEIWNEINNFNTSLENLSNLIDSFNISEGADITTSFHYLQELLNDNAAAFNSNYWRLYNRVDMINVSLNDLWNTTQFEKINQTVLNQTFVNQTLVNQSYPTSYVNKTQSMEADITPAIGVAVVAGVISGVGTSVVVGRRKQELLP
jgi:hypothetical protein